MGLAVVNDPRSIGESATGVMVWWISLSVISVVNIVGWIIVARGQPRRVRDLEPSLESTRRWQLGLSALFVMGCAFGSFLPRAEAQRICLYDSWISAAVISRAVATVAELSMVAQWMLFLREYARGIQTTARATLGLALSRLLVPLIAIAEVFSWYTTLTSNFIGSVVEESTWALTASLLVVGLASIWPRYRRARRRLISTMIVFNVAYVIFMCSVDVPMYLGRWRADQARGKTYLSVSQGLSDATHRRVVTRAWADWRDEIPWMTLYFSAGVWGSLALVQVRPFRDHADSIAPAI
jgi:hypothetical protein